MNEEFYHKDLFGTVVDAKPSLEEEFEDAIGPKGRSDFNVFALTDALGARKKKEAWILYQKALASGLSVEEVFFKLLWQTKTLLLAKSTKTAEEADMKAYPYSKAKGYLRNFKDGELEQLSENLMIGYHQARRGEGDLETFVEKFILSI
ncbi:MAG: hypothetical protein WDZ64_00445 [Parcubacteria group bacterium]